MERTDANLSRWAEQHLLYEVRMLQRAAALMREGELTNVEVESFAVHARCLTEFLWKAPNSRYPNDARAAHFCDVDAWDAGDMPPHVAAVGLKTARDVVHLTFGRFNLTEEAKDWDTESIIDRLAEALGRFAEVALPERLSSKARVELRTFARKAGRRSSGGYAPVATSMPGPG